MKDTSRRKPSASSGPQPTAASKTPASAAAAFNLRAWGIAAGFLLLGLLIYFPSLSGPFVLDDFDLMEVFSAVRIGDWNAVWLTGRPFVMMTYVWNHRLAGGFEPFPFHFTNVLLHGL